MLEVYLGNNTNTNQDLLTILTTYGVAYRCTKACEVNREIILSLFAKTTDCFELLSPRFLRFKSQYSISLNEMIQLILQKPDQTSASHCLSESRLSSYWARRSTYFSSQTGKRRVVSGQSDETSDRVGVKMNERFWDNLEIILAEKDLTWAELARKVFNGQYVYPSEFNRLYQKLRHYKSNRLMPQIRWVERIVLVLDIDYEDLFKR